MDLTSTNTIATCPLSVSLTSINISLRYNEPRFAFYELAMPDEPHSPASSYAGRWVARLRGKVIAQGGTPELARRAAKSSRYKENPEILYMPASFSIPPLIEKIKEILPADQEVYLVGGAVRDLLLNRLSRDFDFAVPSNGISLARRVANKLNADYMTLDDERNTGRVIVTESNGTRIFLDFATVSVPVHRLHLWMTR